MAATEKLLHASSVLYTDRRNFYVDPQVTKELWTDVAPFTTMISNQEQRKVPDPVFKMFEHRNPWVKQEFRNNAETVTLAVNGTESAALNVDGIVGLSSTCDSSWVGLIVEIWNSARDSKKATAMVSSIHDADEIKVKIISTESGSDYDLVAEDWYIVIGNAHGEGSSAPDAWADELDVVYNSCQIFKTPLQVTGTLEAAVLRGESSELARLRRQKAQEHKMQKEKSFLFGQRVGGTGLGDAAYDAGNKASDVAETFADGGRVDSAGNIIRSTYGIVSAMDKYGESGSYDYQNVFSISEASYTYSNFVDDMEKVFQYVPEAGVKRAFCGAGALGYWSKIAGTTGMA